ncbi:MAG: IclR family transcriptional regulator [Alphaproteobacteria bacterium]|nr:IclR family transcriptional regulator [Alphaproteobacteria bacterium]
MDTTIAKGLRVLEVLAASDQPRGISEIAREIAMNKSNVQRIVGTLHALGYVSRDPRTARYAATCRMWEFGIRVLHRNHVRRAAQPYLRALFEKLNESVFLCVPDSDDVLYLNKMESASPVRISARIGSRVPAIRTASGKAILTYLPAEAIKRAVVAARDRFRIEDIDMSRLLEEFATIRKDGFAVSESGYRPGVSSIAAAILARDGTVAGSIAVTGPIERMDAPKLTRFAPEIVNAATRISEAL